MSAAAALAATAAVTAPLAAAARPWRDVEQMYGRPLVRVDHPLLVWAVDVAATTPVLTLLLWLAVYSMGGTSIIRIARAAHHGHHAPLHRVRLGIIVLGLAWATHTQVTAHLGTGWAVLAVGALVGAWAALGRTSTTEATLVRRVNLTYAWTRRRARRAAAWAATPVTTDQ